MIKNTMDPDQQQLFNLWLIFVPYVLIGLGIYFIVEYHKKKKNDPDPTVEDKSLNFMKYAGWIMLALGLLGVITQIIYIKFFSS